MGSLIQGYWLCGAFFAPGGILKRARFQALEEEGGGNEREGKLWVPQNFTLERLQHPASEGQFKNFPHLCWLLVPDYQECP